MARRVTVVVAVVVWLAALQGCGPDQAGVQGGKLAARRDRLAAPTREHGLPPIRPGQYPAGKGTPARGGGAGSGTWSMIQSTPPQIAAGVALLLTDGSVMVQDLNSYGHDWWRLRPDAQGSYLNGSWSQLASLPGDYAPLYFASAVLGDGRVIVMGGEYQAFQATWEARGAIYDPRLDQWTEVAPPPGWTTIGDAQSAVLADGRFVLADCCSNAMAVLDPVHLTWTPIGSGKADLYNDEEGWTLLWDGDLLTVDTNNVSDLTHSERFHPATGVWSSAGSTIVQLADIDAAYNGSWEIGAQMLRPDGTVFVAGALGPNAIYDSRRRRWRVGPSFPVLPGEGQLDQADGPAALLPSGNVLLAVSAGLFNTPAHFYEFDGRSLFPVATPADAIFDSSYNINLLLLPTGEVLETDFSADVELYSPAGCADRDWAPQISGPDLSRLRAGRSYPLRGQQLHGLSQAVAYGDDAQAATNYPLVRITNRASGHVAYARTHGFSNFSIAPGATSSAVFDLPADLEPGDSELQVIANGIASQSLRTRILAP